MQREGLGAVRQPGHGSRRTEGRVGEGKEGRAESLRTRADTLICPPWGVPMPSLSAPSLAYLLDKWAPWGLGYSGTCRQRPATVRAFLGAPCECGHSVSMIIWCRSSRHVLRSPALPQLGQLLLVIALPQFGQLLLVISVFGLH